ncbi:MAG: c-type cytochrome domain-containing protein [Terriglobia bacterium]
MRSINRFYFLTLCSLIGWFSFAICSSLPLAAEADTSSGTIDFVKQVQPIFTASCIRCHGATVRMGQLRLDSKPLAMQGGISGKVLIPGKSSESFLIQRVLGEGDRNACRSMGSR